MANGFVNLDHSLHHQLFAVTDDLYKLHSRPKEVTKAEYAHVLSRVCASLRTSLGKGLEGAINRFCEQAKKGGVETEASKVVGDLKAFTEFLNFEEKLLRGCGVSPGGAKAVVQAIHSIRESTNAELGKLDAERIIASVKELCDKACSAQDDANAHVESLEYKHWFRRFTLKYYGTIVVGGNLSALAISLGGSAVLTTVSVGLGGLLLTWDGKISDPSESPPKGH